MRLRGSSPPFELVFRPPGGGRLRLVLSPGPNISSAVRAATEACLRGLGCTPLPTGEPGEVSQVPIAFQGWVTRGVPADRIREKLEEWEHGMPGKLGPRTMASIRGRWAHLAGRALEQIWGPGALAALRGAQLPDPQIKLFDFPSPDAAPPEIRRAQPKNWPPGRQLQRPSHGTEEDHLRAVRAERLEFRAIRAKLGLELGPVEVPAPPPRPPRTALAGWVPPREFLSLRLPEDQLLKLARVKLGRAEVRALAACPGNEPEKWPKDSRRLLQRLLDIAGVPEMSVLDPRLRQNAGRHFRDAAGMLLEELSAFRAMPAKEVLLLVLRRQLALPIYPQPPRRQE